MIFEQLSTQVHDYAKQNLVKTKMAIEVTDVVTEEQSDDAPPGVEPVEPPEQGPIKQQLPAKEPSQAAAAVVRTRGLPPGAKDTQPRKRALLRAPSEDEIENYAVAQPRVTRRTVTRRSPAPHKQQHSDVKRRFVQIAVPDSPRSTSSEEEPEMPPPSPRTQRHQQWTAYRQQQADVHKSKVNHYANLFDKMLA